MKRKKMKTIHLELEDNLYEEIMKQGINIQIKLKEYLQQIISCKDDVEIIDINDKDYKKLTKYREERKLYPENYVDENSIKWD